MKVIHRQTVVPDPVVQVDKNDNRIKFDLPDGRTTEHPRADNIRASVMSLMVSRFERRLPLQP
jgi:hypothetical protein